MPSKKPHRVWLSVLLVVVLVSLAIPALCGPQSPHSPMLMSPTSTNTVNIVQGNPMSSPPQPLTQPAINATPNNKPMTNVENLQHNQPTKPPMVHLTRQSSTTSSAQLESASTQSFFGPSVITMDVSQKPPFRTTSIPKLIPQTPVTTTTTTTLSPTPESNNHSEHIFDTSNLSGSETSVIGESHLAQPSEVRPFSAEPGENSPVAPDETPVVASSPTTATITTSTSTSTTTTTTTTTALPAAPVTLSTTPAPQARPNLPAVRLPEYRSATESPPVRPSQPSSTSGGSNFQYLRARSKFKCKSSDDCNNGALCVNGTCYCLPGFTGETCSSNVDECRLFQDGEPACFNGGICIDEVNNFRCDCPPGLKGDRCQESIDMCAGSPCLNGAECINHRTNYTCECKPGWEGRHCEFNVDECSKNPCQNNGTCHDLENDYKCDCGNSGFTGKNCEVNFDDCASKPCGFAAIKCIDLIGDFECVCHEGFMGKKCDIDIDECQTNPCENNGTCIQKSMNIHHFNHTSTDLTMYHEQNLTVPSANFSHYAGYTCDCLDEYYGERCEEKKKCFTKSVIELCNHQQAECVNVDSSYECLINASFDGSRQHYATYRVTNPDFRLREIYIRYRSLFGGTVISFDIDQLGSRMIELHINKSGPYLSGPLMFHEEFKPSEYLDGNDVEVRLTLDVPLEIKAITLTRPTSESPFKGCIMQIRLNNQLLPFVEYGASQTFELSRNASNLEVGQCRTCFDKDCHNGGHCAFQEGFDHCACPNSFTGHFCERDVDECQKNFNLCMNGGACENTHGGYRCRCKEGFRGDKCDHISDYCKAKQPCVHGTCENVNPRTFHCNCPSAYFGERCENKRDCSNECHSLHAHCVNNVTCACLPGEKRMKCEYVSSCEQVEGELCLNGGTCKNLDVGGYHCHCLEPFYGPICQFISEKPPVDIILLVVVTCVCLLLAACAVISLVIFRSVRKARATRGTYSPSTQEKFGNSASDLLKPPQRERLI